MPLGPPGRRNEPLNVFWMAFALVLAAGIGAAAGLIWHASGFGDDAEDAPAGEVAAD
jgi:hypothetical protein